MNFAKSKTFDIYRLVDTTGRVSYTAIQSGEDPHGVARDTDMRQLTSQTPANLVGQAIVDLSAARKRTRPQEAA